jgi:hypothetical protein
MAYFYLDFRDTAKQDVLALPLLFFSNSPQNQSLATSSSSSFSYIRHMMLDHRNRLMMCSIDILEAEGQLAAYIIVDALDECPNTGLVSPRERVLDLLEELVDLRLPNLRICATSRPEANIITALEPLASHTVSS